MKDTRTKGITLIALVIEIIILLILAGTSINMLAGEHGLITMAIRARDAYMTVQDEEVEAIEGQQRTIEDSIEN